MLISWALFARKQEHFHPYNKIVTWDIRVWLLALHSYVNVCHVRHMMESLKSILRLPHSTRPSTLVLYWTCAVQHLQQLLMFWYCLCYNINNIKTLQKTNNFTVTQKTVIHVMHGSGFFFILFLFTEKIMAYFDYTNSKLYHLLEERNKNKLKHCLGSGI